MYIAPIGTYSFVEWIIGIFEFIKMMYTWIHNMYIQALLSHMDLSSLNPLLGYAKYGSHNIYQLNYFSNTCWGIWIVVYFV